MSLPIPDDVLDSDIAILGRKGGGKTITAKNIAERLLKLKRRLLVLTPLPGWEGLRTSADGKKPAYPVAIIGGEKADYPLDLALAKPLAQVLAKENVPSIIDLSDETKGKQQRFLLEFLQELRRVNRDPMTIFLEEGDVFAPQTPMGDDSKALHAEIDWIARRGRARGFRLVTICQRPARLAKDVLTQASVLISHTLPSPQDRDAVRAWVEGNGDRDEARKVFDTLAELAPGESWIWSTVDCHRFLKRAKWPMIGTLDTTRTPRAGEKRIEQKTLADVDVSAIKAALETAKAPKPKAIVTIQGKATPAVVAMTGAAAKAMEKDVERRLRAAYDDGARRGIEQANATSRAMFETFCKTASALIRPLSDLLGRELKDADRTKSLVDVETRVTKLASKIKVAPFKASGDWKKPPAIFKVRVQDVDAVERSEFPGSNVPGAARKMIAVLHTYPPVARSWSQAATLAGIRARGGHFNTGKKYLLDNGIVREEGGRVVYVNASQDAQPPDNDPAALVDQWEKVLSGAAPKILRFMFDERQRFGNEFTATEIADALTMQPRGGHWNTAMKELRDNEIILKSGAGYSLSALFGG